MKRLVGLFVVGALAYVGLGVYLANAAFAKGNPPGSVCTGYRYGKGGGKTCIRWIYLP